MGFNRVSANFCYDCEEGEVFVCSLPSYKARISSRQSGGSLMNFNPIYLFDLLIITSFARENIT